jgi:hypothetical protein
VLSLASSRRKARRQRQVASIVHTQERVTTTSSAPSRLAITHLLKVDGQAGVVTRASRTVALIAHVSPRSSATCRSRDPTGR